MTWGAIGGAAVSVVGGAMLNGGGGGGGGGGQQMYIPQGLPGADQGWQAAFGQQQGIADSTRALAMPDYLDAYGRNKNLDWSGYVLGAENAGAAYGRVGNESVHQMDQFRQRAGGAAGAEDMMYDAAGQVWRTAQDPQNQLYDRTAQRLQDQVRSGQAARGLGNSEVGMMEEAGAMSNFNIDWQNAQLARQATGAQAAGGAVGAGVNAGRMYGADMSAAAGAGAAAAGYYGQEGSVPFQVQQQWANGPATAANGYVGNVAPVAGMYGNVDAAAIPYMNYGQGAQQQNWQNQYTQNRDMIGGLSQIGQKLAPSVADWFGSSGGGGPQQPYNPGGYSPMGGGDPYYGGGQNWGV